MKNITIIIISLLLSLNSRAATATNKNGSSSRELTETVDTNRLKSTVKFLASDSLAGRLTGSDGEKVSTQMIAKQFANLGLYPFGSDGSYFQTFEYIYRVALGDKNSLRPNLEENNWIVGKDWTPLSFSQTGQFVSAPVVFAGYGIEAPAIGENKAYNSYENLTVNGRWVVVFRFVPEKISLAEKYHLNRYSRLQHKAMVARNHGAAGLIVVNGPTSQVKTALMQLKYEGSSDSGIPVLTVTDEVAAQWFKSSQKDLKTVQEQLDEGKMFSHSFEKLSLEANVDIKYEKRNARNVLGLLKADGATKTLIIGAHGDHLGLGETGTSLSPKPGLIHPGADDNASGVATLLEIASLLSRAQTLKQNILFTVWTGEEIGLIGSHHFVAGLDRHGTLARNEISAYLNLDMVGRLRTQVSVFGTGSSERWPAIVSEATKKFGLTPAMSDDPYVPSDAMSFYLAEIPILWLHTGPHSDYHKPSDTADKLNYKGMANIALLTAELGRIIATQEERLPYQKIKSTKPRHESPRRQFRITLGTIPEHAQAAQVKGVKISGVVTGGPAETAGLKAGDVIVEFGEKTINNIYDYMYMLQAFSPNVPTAITVLRGAERLTYSITPASKN